MLLNYRNYAVTLLLGMVMPCVAQGATIVITDPDFGPHWNAFHITIGTGTGSFASAENLPTGGNPGAYRRSDHIYGGSSTVDVLSWLFNFDTSNVFDPSLEPIDEVSISFDAIIFSASNNRAQFGPVARQGGRVFHFDPMASGFGTFAWNRYEFDSLTENDFVPSEPAFPTASLDFSSTGSPIEFGYYSLGGGFFTASAVTGADNWRLEVNFQPIPEPSSLIACVSLAVVGLAGNGWRRRKKRLS